MLERLYEDATSFGFPEERFERLYREVEATLYRDALAARRRGAAARGGHRGRAGRAGRRAGAGARGDGRRARPRRSGPRTATASRRVLCVLERDVTADEGITAERGRGALPPLRQRAAPVGARARDAWARPAGGAPTRAPGSRCRSAAAPARRRATGSCRAARSPACASSSWPSSEPTRPQHVAWALRSLRDGLRARPRTPRRCPTTCSRCARCWTRRATPARRAWRCGWRRCAPRRASAGWCSGGSSRRWRWSAS